MGRTRTTILVLFTLSGVSGLIYEVTWIRMLSHLLGGTSFAISTVLAAFMGGLALGSRFFGARTDRTPRLLELYARLEFGIAGLAGLSYAAIRLLPPAYAATAQSLPEGAVAVLRIVIAAALLLPPTFLMGGTLPVLSRFVVRNPDRLGRGLGLLYAVNTFGAVAGCFLSGFVLMAALGVEGSMTLAVVLNLLIGAAALGLARALPAAERIAPAAADGSRAGAAAAPAPAAGPVRSGGLGFGLLGAIFALSGFVSLGYELYWTRALQHFLGNSTYAFSAMLTTFLCGLALGGWIGGRLADRARRPAALLGWIQIGAGAAALASVLLIWGWLPQLGTSGILNDGGLSWTAYLWRRFLIAFAVMAPATLLIGMTFPVVSRLGIESLDRIGRGVGRLYFLNTLGAIAGSLAAGFLVLPLLAAKGALVLSAILSIALGLVAHAGTRPRRPREVGTAGLVLALLAAASPLVLGFGRAPLSDTQEPGDAVLFQREDHAAETRVYRKPGGDLHMSVDGHHIGGDEPSILRKEKILAHLPLALRPDAHRVLSVGLGSGITLGTLGLYTELERLDCVEIVPGVVEGARLFAAANGNVLDDPRVRVRVADGVQFLLTSNGRYDLISSDSKLNPEYAGNAPLLSRDYYALCRDRLTDDGVMVQWLASHLPQVELEVILRSFAAAFPRVAVYWYDPYNLILAGSRAPIVMDLDALRAHLERPEIAADLADLQLDDPYLVAGLYLADGERLRAVLGPGPMNTWARPRIEFTLLREFRRKPQSYHETDNLRWMRELRDPSTLALRGACDPLELERFQTSARAVLEGFAVAGGLDRAGKGLEVWRRGLEQNPRDRRLAALTERWERADRALEEADAAGRVTDAPGLVSLALTRLDQDRPAEALALLDRALALAPAKADILYNRLLALRALERREELAAAIADFRRRFPRDARGLAMAGRLAGEAGRYEESLPLLRRAVELDPESPVHRNNLATTLARLKRWDEAAAAFAGVCELQSDFPGAAFYAAACHSMAGQLEEAARWMTYCLERGLATREQFETNRLFAALRESGFWPE